MSRTPKFPFVQSRASTALTLMTAAGTAIVTGIPFIGFEASIGLAPLPPVYFAWLVLTIGLYMTLATMVKYVFIKKH